MNDVEPESATASSRVASPVPDRWRHSARELSAGYFWYFAAIGTFSPFSALYYRELGFSGIEVGLLTSLPAAGVALFGPLWGATADTLGIHRSLLRGALSVGAIAALAASQVEGFLALFALIAILALALVPVAPLLDSYGMTIHDRFGTSYGSLRVWGSVGYMVLVLVIGRLMGSEVTSLLLVGHAVCLLIALLVTARLPQLHQRATYGFKGAIGEIKRNRPLLLLLTVAFLMTCSTLR